MKRKVLAAIVIAMGLMVTGCGEDVPTDSPLQTLPPQTVSDEPSDTLDPSTPDEPSGEEEGGETDATGRKPGGETHTIGQRSEVNGQVQSRLTGEWKDAEVANRRSLALMIPNNKAAMPQYGISYASIIYEAPVEGAITRIMGIFEDYDDLDRIGPARSSRDYYVYEAMAYGSIYCNWGLAVPYVAPIINTDRIDNVSQPLLGIEQGGASEAYDRVSRPGYSKEYTGYLFIDGYKKAVDRLGYDKTYADYGKFDQAFTFADEGYVATYDSYPDATKVYPGGTQSNSGGYGNANPCFEYNPEDGLYYRSQYGSAQIDEYNGEQLAVSNVVFKICHGEARDANGYLAFELHGKGDAYVFTNGKVIKGTWEHRDDYDNNTFRDENGNEIVFNQGKTWICCIWKEYADKISYE